MTLFNLNFRGRTRVKLVPTDNENNVTQEDIQNMLDRINALEERVEELERNQKHYSYSSSCISPNQVQQPLFGQQQSLFGPPQQGLFSGRN